MNYAPILIPTLNRYTHLKRCVESLAKCTYADKTDLFIALDYPLKEEHWEGYRKIKEYICSIEGFNNVIIIKRNENFGPYQNEIDATQLISEKYDRIIVTEDDNEFAPGFLDYINKGLDRYEDDPKIIAICGFSGAFTPPVDYEPNYAIRKSFSAWGYGTWFHKKCNTIYSPNQLKMIIKRPLIRHKIKYYYKYHYYNILSYIMNKENMWGDGVIAIDMVIDDTFCVYPKISLVRNYGHDGSGVHCGYLQDSPYSKLELDNRPTFDFIGEAPVNDPRYVNLLRNYHPMPIKKVIKFWIKALLKPKKIINLFL